MSDGASWTHSRTCPSPCWQREPCGKNPEAAETRVNKGHGLGSRTALAGSPQGPGRESCTMNSRTAGCYHVNKNADSTEQTQDFNILSKTTAFSSLEQTLRGRGFHRLHNFPFPCGFSGSHITPRQVYTSASTVRRVFQYHFSWNNLLSIIFMAALNFKRELRRIENLLRAPAPKESLS